MNNLPDETYDTNIYKETEEIIKQLNKTIETNHENSSEILKELNKQGEIINNSKKKLDNIDENVKVGNNLLKRMQKKCIIS